MKTWGNRLAAKALYLGTVLAIVFSGQLQTGVAQISPVAPVPSGGDALKADQAKILGLFDALSKGIQNHDSKAVLDCFVSRLPDYYLTLISPDFKVDPNSTTQTIDLLLHKGLTRKMSAMVQKSPTLNDFVQNSFNKSAVFHAGSGNMPPASELLGDIQVDGDSAVAPLRAANKRFPIQLVFSREKGQWKIDPFPILANLQLILSFDQMKNNRTADQESDIYLRQIPDFDSMGKPAKQTGVDDSGLEKAAPPVPTVSASPPSPVISATPAASPTP